jgi:hypothetical protein
LRQAFVRKQLLVAVDVSFWSIKVSIQI